MPEREKTAVVEVENIHDQRLTCSGSQELGAHLHSSNSKLVPKNLSATLADHTSKKILAALKKFPFLFVRRLGHPRVAYTPCSFAAQWCCQIQLSVVPYHRAKNCSLSFHLTLDCSYLHGLS